MGPRGPGPACPPPRPGLQGQMACSCRRLRRSTRAAARKAAPVSSSAMKLIQPRASDQPKRMSTWSSRAFSSRRHSASWRAAAEYARYRLMPARVTRAAGRPRRADQTPWHRPPPPCRPARPPRPCQASVLLPTPGPSARCTLLPLVLPSATPIPSPRLSSCVHSSHIPLRPHSPAQTSVTAQVGTATLHLFVR